MENKNQNPKLQVELEHSIGERVFRITLSDNVHHAGYTIKECIIDKITITKRGISYHCKALNPSCWHGEAYVNKVLYPDLKAATEDLKTLPKCPFGGDETDDCADCAYASDYHYADGECVLRETK